MAAKEITVVINGKEYVSKAAGEAEAGVASFVDRVKGSFSSFVDFKAAWDFVAGAVQRFAGFVGTSIDEAKNSREAMGQLALAVNNSGTSFGRMAPAINDALNNLSRVTKFGDDDFARVMGQMVLKTGDASWSLKSLGQVADLAAAANIDLASAGDLLAKAHEGNTKALFKLVPELKGASNWEELLEQKTRGAAAAQMEQVGPLEAIKKQFGEVQESIGKAILGNETFTGVGYSMADMLADLAGWIDANAEGLTGLLTSAMDMANAFKGVAGPSAKILATFLFLLSEGVQQVWAWIENLAYTTEHSVGAMLKAFGTLIEKGGKLLEAFGISVGTDLGRTLTEAGENMVGRSENILVRLQYQYTQHQENIRRTWTALWGDVAARENDATLERARQGRLRVKNTETDLADEKRAWDQHLRDIEATYKLLNQYVVPYREVLKTLQPTLRDALDKEHAARFNETWKAIDDSARTLIDRMKANPLPALIKPAGDEVGRLASELETSAGRVLDVGTQFGALDGDAKKVVETAKGLGATVKDIALNGFTFAGVTGVIGGVASLVSTMMQGDKERRELTRKNTEAMDKLRTEGVTLSSKVSGDKVSAIANALDPAVVRQLSTMDSSFGNIRTAGTNQLVQLLARSGLRLSDLDALASEFGMSIRRQDGSVALSQLPALLEALQSNVSSLTRVGQSFSDQYAYLKETQRITGTSGMTQVSQLVDFLRGAAGNVRAFQGLDTADPAALRNQLLTLFAGLNSNAFSPADFGNLTGTQFKDVLLELIGLLDNARADVPASSTGGGVTSSDVSAPDAAGVTPSARTLDETLQAMSDSLSEILTESASTLVQISDATADSARYLASIDGKMDVLIAVTRGGDQALDERLASINALARLSAGAANAF